MGKFSFVLLDILYSKGSCILVTYEMVSAHVAAKQISYICSVLDYKATNINKYMKEANDFSTCCDNKPAKINFNQSLWNKVFLVASSAILQTN